MPDISVIRRGTGGMDFDSSPEYIAVDDYRSAYNIQGTSDGHNGDKRNEIVKGTGTTPDITLPDVQPSSKQYKVSGINSMDPFVLRITYSNRVEIDVTFPCNLPGDLVLALTAIFPGPDHVVISTTGSDYVIFSIEARYGGVSYDGFDFFVEYVSGLEVTIECIREAIPLGLSGKQYPIGSFDILGDLFIWSTTNKNLPETKPYSITNIVTLPFGGGTIVTTNSAHNLSTGDVIRISNVVGDAQINGVHFIVVTGPNTFALPGVIVLTYTSGGVITSDPVSHGSISVHQKDRDSGTWSSYILLSSRELNFKRKKQIDVDMERDAERISAYFTDDYNQPRVFYYKGDYIANGAISTVSSNGQYSYDSISEELRLAVSSGLVTIDFSSQLSSGGSLLDGNYRYTCRFLTESGTPTAWIPLSSPINVANGDYASPKTVKGGADGSESTGKINIIRISGNFESIFKQIEVAYVQYLGSSFTSGIFYRGSVPLSDSDIEVTHTGNESSESFDIGTLNDASPSYETAKNIRIVDNRLVLSNLTTQTTYDFTEFTEAITYSLQKYTVDTAIDGWYNFLNKEYLDPENVFSKVGYTLNETYRFAFVYELYNGYRTQPYYTGYDITFDTNTVSPTAPGREASGGLSNYDLQPIAGLVSFVDIPYVRFTMPDIDSFISDGVRFRNVVKRVHVMRAELVNKTVLASGLCVLCVNGRSGDVASSNSEYTPISPSNGNIYNGDGTTVNKLIAETMGFYTGNSFQHAGLASILPDSIDPNSRHYPQAGYVNSFIAENEYASFYSGDILLGGGFDYSSGDVLRVYPAGSHLHTQIGFDNGATTTPDYNTEFDNYSIRWLADHGGATYSDYNVSSVDYVGPESELNIGSGKFFTKHMLLTRAAYNGTAAIYSGQKSILVKCSSPIVISPSGSNYGVAYAQYVRPLTNQYGDYRSNNFSYTGAYIDINQSTASSGNTIDTFGGDTFTQTTYVKAIGPSNTQFVGPSTGTSFFQWSGWGSSVSWIGQNKYNFQMRGDGENPPDRPTVNQQGHFPSEITKEVWLTRRDHLKDIYVYNHGYDIRNQINRYRAFDPTLYQSSDLPATIAYSDIKVQGGQIDNYRLFLPLNRKDLSLVNGEINHHEVVNGELVTIQNRSFQRQFFNTTGILSTVEGAEVIMGDGAALTRKGATISSYGTRNKWSAVKGRSQGGSDVLYWFDSEMGVFVRLGYDGVIPISIRANMDSFFRSQMRFSFDRDTPADDEGVHAVWDESYKRLIITSRCRIADFTEYDPLTSLYLPGATVHYPGAYTTYEETGEYFVCALPAAAGESPATDPDKWLAVPHSNTDYYNEYTIVWDEGENKFKCFFTPVPKIYFRYSNGYLISDPKNENEIFEANKSNYSQWFGSQSADASVDFCFNDQPEIQKTAVAISADSYTTPSRFDFETRGHSSYLISSEFEILEDQYRSPVKNDSSATGVNDGDTSRIFGRYVFAKMTMASGAYNWVRSVIMKMRPRHRLPMR